MILCRKTHTHTRTSSADSISGSGRGVLRRLISALLCLSVSLRKALFSVFLSIRSWRLGRRPSSLSQSMIIHVYGVLTFSSEPCGTLLYFTEYYFRGAPTGKSLDDSGNSLLTAATWQSGCTEPCHTQRSSAPRASDINLDKHPMSCPDLPRNRPTHLTDRSCCTNDKVRHDFKFQARGA